MVSLAFAVHTTEPIGEIAFEVGALTGPSGSIDAGATDVFVVKVWEQAGVGVYQSKPVRVPELLVKDDRPPLSDGYRRWCGHWRHLHRRSSYYVPPAVRSVGPACTSLDARETKQVWLSVRVPADAAPGRYTGMVAASAHGHLVIELEVLPFALVEPAQDLMMWYKATLDCRLSQHWVTPAVYEAQLRDIHDHGFRSISINDHDPEFVRQAIEIARSVGFRRNLVLLEEYPPATVAQWLGPLTPVYYLSDELDARGPSAVGHHIANWREARRRGAKGMVSLLHRGAERRFSDGGDIGHPPDIVSYYLPHNHEYFRAHSESPDLRARDTYYYWLSHMEKPLLHRVLSGFYLWKSGASGIAPYCYQHLPRHPYSPFDDFDEWEPGFHVGGERRPFKDHMTTYPARGGSIPTLQWKGLSDGITDLRDLTTLDRAATDARAHERAAARALAADVTRRRDALLARFSLTHIDIVSEQDAAPYDGIGAADLRAAREQIARDTVALHEAMGVTHRQPAVA
jgi:hypothetical protein